MTKERFCAMIVDDDPMLLDGLSRALRAEPYDLYMAGDADHGFSEITRVRPDVIVSDFQLPGANGVTLLSRVKELLPDSCRILMTGSPSLAMAIDAINQGAVSRLFLKPFQTMHLAVAMREAFERAELLRLSMRLVQRAMDQEHIIERVRQSAPHLLTAPEPKPRRSDTGAMTTDDYQPHDQAGVLRALRLVVR